MDWAQSGRISSADRFIITNDFGGAGSAHGHRRAAGARFGKVRLKALPGFESLSLRQSGVHSNPQPSKTLCDFKIDLKYKNSLSLLTSPLPPLASCSWVDRWVFISRTLHRLSSAAVKKPGLGLHSDGGNLYLQVAPGGSKSWSFRFMLDGKSREMGLGPLHTISLAEARQKALEARDRRSPSPSLRGPGSPLFSPLNP